METNQYVNTSEPSPSKGKRAIKLTAIILLGIIGAAVLFVGGYVLYVIIQYNRIEDNHPLTVSNNASTPLLKNTEYTIITYNIGFGAYDADYSFFMDTGTMKTGESVKGKYGKGASRERVQNNTNGSFDIVKNADADFYLLQEVDVKSTRSYNINQVKMFTDISGYGSTYAENFHSAFLMYPLNDMHGKVKSGIVTLSKYEITSAVRRSFPITDAFFAKFFDLDRCFSVHYLPVEGGNELTLINLHMSAYDEGGKIRAKQLEMLNQVLKDERDKGNYVIAGGDFNHDIADTLDKFPTTQELPEWVFQLTNSDLTAGFTFAADATAPSCRSADIPYTEGVNYTVSIDGFAVSDNVTAKQLSTLTNGFLYSDHHPVMMTFTLS